MRMQELEGKEIVNIFDGVHLGTVGESDLNIDATTGEVLSIILPNRGNLVNFWADRQKMIIPWNAIKKIGREVLVIDVDHNHLRLKNNSF